jgi:hypothetical protein
MYTVEQYQTLCRMIGKGVTSLEVNGEKVSFRSLAEMLRLKGLMEAELGLGAAARGMSRVTYPAFRKE